MAAPLTDDELKATAHVVAAHPGDTPGAARALGISTSALYRRLARIAQRGFDGSTPAAIPAGQVVKGVSTLHTLNPVTGEMEQRAIWTKTREEGFTPEDFAQVIRDVAKDLVGSIPPVPAPKTSADGKGSFHLFPWPDLHFGMLSWAEETGESFDLKIAERLVMDAFSRLVAQTPDADEAILLGLGDLLHSDDESGTTKRSGNRLDVDGRFAKVRRVVIRVLAWAIRLLLARFPKVTVRLLPGNHDEETAVALAEALALLFDAEDRVEFDLDPGLWWFYRRGVVQIGATHGHTCKPAKMPGVMIQRRPHDYAAATVHRFYHGHLHNTMVGEEMGVPIECLQTIIPGDAYHIGGGYGGGRSMIAVEFHETRGEVGRKIVGVVNGKVLQ
ncbi:hypothetical protein [Roseobacter weihaiensis]|uniref:hypothetical protein n=1 Tax=Roseobacter weihaiensis TaxID=2763262 RepID=UPI001D0AE256|nr:hypothetical protein [Roseobacter sp. H9]